MSIFKNSIIALALAGLSLACTSAFASVVSENLSFGSQNQSMWGPGAATQFKYNQFIGTTWNKSLSAGGFIGGTTKILNPLWVAWNACPFHLCGSEPSKYSYIDTKTGAQVSASTSGKVGFNVGFSMNSGSLDSLSNYKTQVTLPTAVQPGQLVSLNTSGGDKMTGGSLNSQFPTMSASLSAVVQASANFAAAACVTGSCTSKSYSTGTLGGTQPLVSFDNGTVTWLGGQGNYLHDIVSTTANLLGNPLPTGLPASFDIPAPSASVGGIGIKSNLGTITVSYPQPNVTGKLNSAGTQISGSASSQAIDFSGNLTNMVATAFDAPGLLGGSIDLGAGFGVDYTLLDVNAGPTISLQQNFTLTPSLYVNLAFSKPVNVAGYGSVTQVDGLDWNNLPSMSFANGQTTVTPTFYLGTNLNNMFTANTADLLNQLLLDLGGNITVNLLNASFNTPAGSLALGFTNPLVDQSFNLFTTPPIFSKEFALGGFSSILGQAFTIDANPVPEPGTVWLMGAGLVGLLGVSRRRRKAAD